MTNKLKNHNGRFTSLVFRDGNKTTAYCAKVKKITDSYIFFTDINSKKETKKSLANLID